MEPLSALSIASAVIQIIDFSSKVIARTREVHRSGDGAVEEGALFANATANLNDLLIELNRTTISESSGYGASHQRSADKQLLQHAKDSQVIATELRALLANVKHKRDGRQRNAIQQGFRGVLEQKNVDALNQRLDDIRKQIDTTLLVSLRQNQDVTVQQNRPGNDAAHRKTKLLSLIQSQDWQPTDQRDLMEFSNQLTSLVQTDLEDHFSKMILGRLYFVDLPHRYENIPKAHRDTFEWVFAGSPSQQDPVKWDGFSEWLSATGEKNVYWATGKPGSGKSTLMKFMYSHSRTDRDLQAWANGLPLVKAGFFFWSSGTFMQMSRNGLLQSLLHKSLKDDRSTLLRVFKHRWHQYTGFGGGRERFEWLELRSAFETMVGTPETSRKFFFMIDGLDEFDGNPKELIDLILGLAKHPHVKICVASRPWLVFADAFEDRPSLRLEQLTSNDIQKYIASFFEDNKHYTRLSRLEPVRASALISDITEKSKGVFLWVHLVVQSLLDGLSNADRLSDLVARVNALPPDLEELYAKLLNSLDADYFTHACQLFRLVMYNERPTLLDLYFVDTEEEDSALRDKVQDLNPEEITSRLETMYRRLISRCKGFLEIEGKQFDPAQAEAKATPIGWIHRTAKDFLQSKDMWSRILEATGHDSFDIEMRWMNGLLAAFKATSTTPPAKWYEFKACIECAILRQHRTRICPVKYLDELGHAAMQKCPELSLGTLTYPLHTPIPRVQTVLDFAVWLRLASWIDAKAQTMTHQDVVHAAKFIDIRIQDPNEYVANDFDIGFLTGAYRYTPPGNNKHTYQSIQNASNAQAALDRALIKGHRRKISWQKTKRRIFG
ncbi:hypothetical protein FB567DRAFT_457239 [Paraphoma chrysanthemicola]|uniref:NACHT domain-containing protein n=1 Tax=Paraphoma chrysanthemicola TaxID=798071 RepID=A0A8K0QSR5_9PLEO|nr:hypothetical protein FB567DRAFT_457239 [Paraphoma chrysanthemicola]